MTIISATNVEKIYKTGQLEVQALKGVDIHVEEGEMIAIMGPSGCGKTTLLNCLSGIDSINNGSITIGDRPIHQLSDDELSDFRAKFMGFVFQTYNLLPVLTARENVELPLLISGYSQKDAKEKAMNSLETVNLADWGGHRPTELSGGQQQRVAIARALVNDPSIVWADEPTGNLDSQNESEIMELITHLNKDNGQTFVLVTHSDSVGARADRIIYMRDGLIDNKGN
ncbi:MAG: ABC transporter ATP-binding protein [Dehalococcoidia bacterium]|nr:ABC transporter ATP-binding protein [Dehalococcoidia bacterium]MQG00538.1 ABC transporter ATP-binding protein [SAR202 cluster bacterium]|tara:strand:- start:31603 stop:32283 length:681 start_codon:yes stop_codon:yes gene_type:complete